MKTRPEHFSLWQYLLFIAVLAAVMCLCVCVGSVNIALADTLAVFRNALTHTPQPTHSARFRPGRVRSASAAVFPSRRPKVPFFLFCFSMIMPPCSLSGNH